MIIYFKIFIIILFVVAIADYLFEYISFSKYNQTPLDIQTFDGSNQPYHPSVIHIPEGWNGHKYWMVETPYPIGGLPYKDRWECPTIHVSENGKQWNSPSKKLIPIDDLNDLQIENHAFFSDPHLVMKNGTMECFYRFSSKKGEGYHTYLLRKTSHDGLTWTEREVLLDLMSEEALLTVGDMVRSQAILYENGQYQMWFVDCLDPKGKKNVCVSTSSDGYHWSQRKTCVLEGPATHPWHIDVNHIDNQYLLTIYDWKDLTLWTSEDGKSFTFSRKLLSPSFIRGSFYSEGLYRSSLIKDDEGYKIYFSAYDEHKTYIGLMAGKTLQNIIPVSINGCRVDFLHFPKTFLHIWKRRIWLLIHSS